MKSMRFVSILCVVSMIAATLCGCSSNSAESVVTVTTAGDALPATAGDAQPASAGDAQPASDATYAQVQSIDGTSITALVGTFGGDMSMPSGDEQQGDSPSGTPSVGDGDQSADIPSGDEQQGDAPSGTPSVGDGDQSADMPSGDGQTGGRGGQGFTAGDETIVFTIGDSTVITLADGTTGTIDDIAVDDVLMLTLDDDNVALTVAVQQVFDDVAPTSTDAVG